MKKMRWQMHQKNFCFKNEVMLKLLASLFFFPVFTAVALCTINITYILQCMLILSYIVSFCGANQNLRYIHDDMTMFVCSVLCKSFR